MVNEKIVAGERKNGEINGDLLDGEEFISYFAAGPSKLPYQVLKSIQDELIKYGDTKISVMEMSHRSSDFAKILNDAEALVRDILSVPSNFKVLFMQSGGSGQFAAIPLNLMGKTGKADYAVTGTWSLKGAKEAELFGEVSYVFPPAKKFTRIPPQSEWKLDDNASYLYYCDNETVEGVEYDWVPEAPPGVPIVCDMSSNICTRKIDFSKFGLIFAGAQKNIGCAGATLVIIRDDLISTDLQLKNCPSVLDYSKTNKAKSIYNTPGTFPIYVMRKCLAWVKESGSLAQMEKNAQKKSEALYGIIDHSRGFYVNAVDKKNRSRMNVTFRIGSSDGFVDLEEKFLKEAIAKNLLQLKGHRSVGGIRASLYNAVTYDDVIRLADHMTEFMKNNKKS